MKLKKITLKILSIGLLAIPLTLDMGCIKRNAADRPSFKFVPASILNSQSYAAYGKQQKEIPVSNNQRKKQIVQRVADRLIVVAERNYSKYTKGFKWEVTLFDKPKTVNAYCMPGGKIGIYTGILPVCENEAALAAVMGHEIAHALLEHGNERVSQGLGVQATLMIAQYGLSAKSGLDKKMQGLIVNMAGVGAQVGVLLPFSRKHETEADIMGLKILAEAGYDPIEAPNLWRRMKAKSGGKAPPPILSTHPSNDSRIRSLEAMQAEVAPLYAKSAKYGKGEKL